VSKLSSELILIVMTFVVKKIVDTPGYGGIYRSFTKSLRSIGIDFHGLKKVFI